MSLDSIGIAGFGHDFGALEGRKSTVEEVFDAFVDVKPSVSGSISICLFQMLNNCATACLHAGRPSWCQAPFLVQYP